MKSARRLAVLLLAPWLLATALSAQPALAANDAAAPRDGSCTVADDGAVSSLGAALDDATSAAGLTRAPDGYVRNAVAAGVPADLAADAAAGTLLDVPYRVQEGPTCGLYALGMVMDYYHTLDRSNASPLVQHGDEWRANAKNFAPTTHNRLFDVAKVNGYFAESERIVHEDGGMFVADQLGQLATKFGYRYALHEPAGAKEITAAVDRGHPALVGFDVDYDGNPTQVAGSRAHWAVIVGHFQHDGEEWFVAHHGWEAKDYFWKASDLEASMGQIQPTLGPKVVEVLPRLQ